MIIIFQLSFISAGKVIILVKQGEGGVTSQYQQEVITELRNIGGQAPFFSGFRGSYILVGHRKVGNMNVPWTTQVLKMAGLGVSELSMTVRSTGKCLHSLSKTLISFIDRRRRCYQHLSLYLSEYKFLSLANVLTSLRSHF